MESNDELIARFANMTTVGEEEVVAEELPISTYSCQNWKLCGLARLVSDRIAVDQHFAETMRRVWGVEAKTSITPVAKNLYLLEFTNEENMQTVIDRGVWTYMSDAVVTRRVNGPEEMQEAEVKHMEVWVQFHHIPPGAIVEGILMLASKLGTPLSGAKEVHLNGRMFSKVKILLEVDKALKDRIVVRHSELGQIVVLPVYEKLNRICCFCGEAGHEMEGCKYRLRLLRLQTDKAYMNRPELQDIAQPKLGAWMSSLSMLREGSLAGQLRRRPAWPNTTKGEQENSNADQHSRPFGAGK